MRVKFLLFLAATILTGATSFSQTLFTYGKYAVGKDEFLRAYNKNNVPVANKEKSLRDYLDLYVNFKLKVQAAEDMKLDTLTQLKADLQNFRTQVQDNYLNDEKGLAMLMNEAFNRSRLDMHVLHFSVSVPAGSNPADTLRAFRAINALAASLSKGGTDYEKQAGENQAKYADLGFVTVFTLPYSYENIVYSLKPGQVSDPVRSKTAWHIFKLVEERNSIGKWKIAQILFTYPPLAGDSVKQAIMKRADSVYVLIKKGADFGKLAEQYSEDRFSYNAGGELPEFGTGKYEPSFEEEVLKLKADGDISEPFTSRFGVHIIKRLGHSNLPDKRDDPALQFEHKQKVLQDSRVSEAKEKFTRDAMHATGFKLTHKVKDADLFRFADSVLRDPTVNNSAKYPISKKILISFAAGKKNGEDWLNFVRDYKGNPTLYQQESDKGLWEKFQRVSVLEYYKSHLSQYSEDFAYQMKEFRDGNLLFEAMERNVWDKAATDTNGLKKYYNEHKEKYKWPESADVILVTASDEKTAKHCVSQLDQGKPWKQVLEEGNALVQIDSGRYELNQLVDSTIREKPTPGSYSKFTTNQDGSVSFTRFIKLYPARQQRSFEEARGLVINDYQAVLEQQWIARLKKQYPVTINENVFKQLLK